MNTLCVYVVDSDFKPVVDVALRVVTPRARRVDLQRLEACFVANQYDEDSALIEATAGNFTEERFRVRIRNGTTQVVLGMRRSGESSYEHGDNRLAYRRDERSFLLHARGPGAAQRFALAARGRNVGFREVSPYLINETDSVYVQIFSSMDESSRLAADLQREGLNVRMLRAIQHGNRPVIGLTNEVAVRFNDGVDLGEAEALAHRADLRIARSLPHAGNAFVLTRDGFPSYDVLDAAMALNQSDRVVYAEPNLTFTAEPDQFTPNDPLWSQVPYLRLIHADDAWERLGNVATDLRGGSADITIAIIDTQGVSPDHSELIDKVSDGTIKLIESMNFADIKVAAQTDATLGGDHGTQCAGTATAAFDDGRGLPGVAPNCRLLGARIPIVNDDVGMCDVFLYVAGFLNGSPMQDFPTSAPSRPADVISLSWGRPGGAPLSNTARDCFDFLTTFGRGGKGCVLCISIGNNGYLDFTDPTGLRYRAWPAYEKVLGIGSSIGNNPTDPVPESAHVDPFNFRFGVHVTAETRSLYSPYGAAVLRKPDLVAPSSTAMFAPTPTTAAHVDPILSAVRVGQGAINGCTAAAPCNDYARTFGGTSHSTPAVAGAAALILSARPDLTWVVVRDLLRRTAARIDVAQTNTIGAWRDLDGDTVVDYSCWYGAGRLDVDAAVAAVLNPAFKMADVYVRDNLADDGAVPSQGGWSESPDIWVRQDTGEPMPVLAWTAPPPHQNAMRGQDNAVYCRVRNRGDAPATVIYLRAMITHWAGLEFDYPADFRSSPANAMPMPGTLARGASLIGEARIDGLAVGSDQIVKLTWHSALIPPTTISVGGVNVLWHPCLLIEASPHDGPWTASGGPALPIQRDNNIAQRNIQIVDPTTAGGDSFIGMMAGTNSGGGVVSLVIDATTMAEPCTVLLHVADMVLMQQLMSAALGAEAAHQATSSGNRRQAIAKPGEPRSLQCIDRGSALEMTVDTMPPALNPRPGDRSTAPIIARARTHQGLSVLAIEGLHGVLEIRLRLEGGHHVPLLVAVAGMGSGDLHISQRRGDRALSPGYCIRRTGASR